MVLYSGTQAHMGAMLQMLVAFTVSNSPRGAIGRTNDTHIPCAHTPHLDPVNQNATLHVLASETPPYALCLRQHQYLDNIVRKMGHWPDCDALRRLIAHDRGVFVDVGANIGACSMMMASLGHRVVSFEPTPPTFVALAAALAGNAPNPLWDVRLVNAGVSNASGTATIFSQPGNAGGSLTTGVGGASREQVADLKTRSCSKGRRVPGCINGIRAHAVTQSWATYQIRLTTLDDEVRGLGPVDLMKLDCQGHEFRALLGASQLLVSPGVRVIKFEFYPIGLRQVGDEPAAILRLLHAAGYELHTRKNRIEPTEEAYQQLERTVNFMSPGGTDVVARKVRRHVRHP